MADTENTRNWPERELALLNLKRSVTSICFLTKRGAITKRLAVELVVQRVRTFTLFYGVADPEPMGVMYIESKGERRR